MHTLPLPRPRPGVLEPFTETGAAGIVWSVVLDGPDDPMNPYARLYHLGDGDQLTVWHADGTIAWRGVIALDRTISSALGWWVDGAQRGMDPDAWARLFAHEPPLRCQVASRLDQTSA